MLSQTGDGILIDNGSFSAVISKASGMMTEIRLAGSGIDLASHYQDYSLVYPEFAIQYRDGSRESQKTPAYYGEVTTEILVEGEEAAIVRVIWDTPFIDTRWEYRFLRDVPYFILYVEREVERSGVYANAQQCAMFTDEMDDGYIVDYQGELLNTLADRVALYPAGYIQHSMFTAIDNGYSTRYPAIIWHDDDSDIVMGVLVTYVTPNQRETISYQNSGIHSAPGGGFVEAQWNWFGKSDNESLYLKGGTKYGMEMYYYLDHGDVDTFDAFNQALFNEGHYDVVESEDYCVASWGGRQCGLADFSWNYPQASNNYITSQELFRYRALSLPRSQNSSRDPQVFDLSVKAVMEGESIDLTPLPQENFSPALHKYARTLSGQDYMVGKVGWEVNSLENRLWYKVFEDSDKLVVGGQISPTRDGVHIKHLFVSLKLPPYRPGGGVYSINGSTWDMRRRDSIYGTLGITVYHPTGIDTVTRTARELRLYILHNERDVEYDSEQVWSYEFFLFPHLGYDVERIAQITPLHHKSVRHYREYYKRLPGLMDNNDLGIRPDGNIFVYGATLIQEQEKGTAASLLRLGLYARPGSYPVRLYSARDDVYDVRVDGRSLEESTWDFDLASRVLTVRRNWGGMVTLEVLFEASSSGLDIYEDPVAYGSLSLLNYPNPFNLHTIISFNIPFQTEAALDVYDLKGRTVRRLFEGGLEEGPHRIVWDGRDGSGRPVASGVYLCRLRTEREIKSRKMLLLR